MNDKKYLGTFYSESQLFDEINRQKRKGYQESDLYIVANNKDDIRMIRGRTDAEVKMANDENWLEKVKHFVMGEEPVLGTFEKMGYSKEQAHRFYTDAKKGGLLLFVDRDLGKTHDKELNVSPYSKDVDYFKTSVGAEPATALKGDEKIMNHQEPEKKSTYDPNDPLQKAAAGEYVDQEDVQIGDRITNEKIKERVGESEELDHRVDDEKPHH